MPDLTSLFRIACSPRALPLLASLAISGFAAAPAAANDAVLPYELVENADAGLAGGADRPARYVQDSGDIDDNILLPASAFSTSS